MLGLLLTASLTCQEAEVMLIRISRHNDLPPRVKIELVETVREATDIECIWDAND